MFQAGSGMFAKVCEGSRGRQTPHLLAEIQEAAGTSNSLLFKNEVVDINLKNTFQINATYICSWRLLNLPWRPDSCAENIRNHSFFILSGNQYVLQVNHPMEAALVS